MKNIYKQILEARQNGQKLLAVLIDPDKFHFDDCDAVCIQISLSGATHIFVGGSQVFSGRLDELVTAIKTRLDLPVILFPGNPSQISFRADGILFLSLLSGRNPDYLIGHHITAARSLRESALEVIPTAYLLVDGGHASAVARVSQTQPMDATNARIIADTALAGELLGHKLVYLEAGSGAKNPVPANVISEVRNSIDVPLIVGGGIRTQAGIRIAYENGADLVVIGTAFEQDLNFFAHE